MSLVIFGETRNISGCDDYFRMRSSSLSPISNTQSQKFSLVPVFHLNSVLSDPPVGGNRRESFNTCSMLQLNPESEPPSEALFLQSALLLWLPSCCFAPWSCAVQTLFKCACCTQVKSRAGLLCKHTHLLNNQNIHTSRYVKSGQD